MSNIQRIIYVLSVTTFCVAVILIGCATKLKEDVSEIEKPDSKFDVVLINADSVLSVMPNSLAEKNKLNRTGIEISIKENEAIITKLKLQIKKPGIQFDNARLQKIELLQLKNKQLKNTIYAHQTAQTN